MVAGTVDPHIYRGVVADRTGNFFGDNVVEWESVSPNNIRINLSKAVLGGSPPASLYIEFNSGRRFFETKVDRASGSDQTLTFAYHRDPASPGIEESTVGNDFSVAFYSDELKTTAVRIQVSTNRWELDNRNAGLNQDGVDHRIDALIPQNRRIPSYTTGDKGQYLRVNEDGLGIGWKPEVGRTEEEVQDAIEAVTDPLDRRVVQVEEFKEASQKTLQIAKDVSVVISTLNSSTIIAGTMIPADSDDAELSITVSAVSIDSGSGAFELSDLYGKTAISGGGVELTDDNSLEFNNAPGTDVYRIARDGNGALYLSSSRGDTYTVSIDVLKPRGGAESFTELNDTQSTLGEAGQAVVVNTDGRTLGFSDVATVAIQEVPDLYDIGLTAASGSVNRKTVTQSNDRVVLSDWSTVDLIENATAFQGITIVDNKIVCANAHKFRVVGSLTTESEGSGGGARAYNDIRIIKIGTPDVELPSSRTASYDKTTDPDVADSADLQQGPRNQIVPVDGEVDAAAGDEFRIEWRAYIQLSPEIAIDSTKSLIQIRFHSAGAGRTDEQVNTLADNRIAANDTAKNVPTFVSLTRAQYMALDPKDANTLYLIT